MAVVRSQEFKCEACDVEFTTSKFYVLTSRKEGDTVRERVARCPECNEQVVEPDKFVIQRSVVSPLCPKTSVQTIIRDRPRWH